MWLADGRSTLDLFGRSLVLMRIGPTPSDVEPLVTAARQRRVPLEAIAIDQPAVTAAYGRRIVLMRPDGHIAWRGDDFADPQTLLDTVCGFHSPAGVASIQEVPSRQVARLP